MDKRRVVENGSTQMTASADIISGFLDDGMESEDVADLLVSGWKISLTSCDCGGRYAWMLPRGSGAYEMFGCVCHRTKDAIRREAPEKNQWGK